MSTAQQLQPLPSLEPAIFASLAVELGFVPPAPGRPAVLTDAADTPPVLALAAPAPAAEDAPVVELDVAEVDEEVELDSAEVDEAVEVEVDEVEFEDVDVSDWAEGHGWADEDWSERAWSAEDTERTERTEPVETVETVEQAEAVEDFEAVRTEHVEPPATPGHGVPTRQVPSMPPISRG